MGKKLVITSIDDYLEYLSGLALNTQEKKSTDRVIHLSPEIGRGSVRAIKLPHGISLLFLDMIFTCETIIPYQLSKQHFEIAYCQEGRLLVGGDSCPPLEMGRNSMTLSTACHLQGEMKFLPGQVFRGISFAAPREILCRFLGEKGICLWEQVVELQEQTELLHGFWHQIAGLEVQKLYEQLLACRFEDCLQYVYMEGKLMEIVSHVLSQWQPGRNHFQGQLDSYEVRQLKQVPIILAEHIEDPPTICQLARMTGMSSTKLKQGFKVMYGDTIFGYFRNRKMEKACQMLLGSNKSIAQIAFELGYANPSKFSAAFKRVYGCMPHMYRKAGGAQECQSV